MTELFHDHETYSEANLLSVGLDRYLAHPSTEVLMTAWSFDRGPVRHWQKGDGPYPRELQEALADPHVVKKAFNAQFERCVANRILNVPSPPKNWRCTQVLAYMQCFTGGLDDVCKAIGLPVQFRKTAEGSKLIRLFCQPQKISKNRQFERRDADTDPEEWERFCAYNVQDVVAEMAVDTQLGRFPIPEAEWELYEIDQEINDAGMPVDIEFVWRALDMAQQRQAELVAQMRELTGLENPNSIQQLTPWLQDRGYPFADLRADTVVKVLATAGDAISDDARRVLRLRQWSARTSTDKYEKLLEWTGPGGRARYMFQFGGASRTLRAAGRGPQPQNLPRTPGFMEDPEVLHRLIRAIRGQRYEELSELTDEPLRALVGSVRSSFQAPEGYEFDVCDLSAIESRVIGWLTGCQRLNKVFADGRDPYKDFGQDLYSKPYEEVTKKERSNSKPAVLGAGFRLGGGGLDDYGKRSGLWGYAESMGVDIPQEEAHRMVNLFRERYAEIPEFWFALEKATIRCVRTGAPQRTGPVRWEWLKPYLTAILPSGRRIFYYQPDVLSEQMISRRGNPYTRQSLRYMGQSQVTHQWTRLNSHGGLLIENLVQSIARDVLQVGIRRAYEVGFQIVGHVHDEIITLRSKGENRLTLPVLRYLMKKPIPWAPGLLLDAAGYSSTVYRKD